MRRGFLLAGLLFVLTGCGGADTRAAFTDSRIPPSLGPRFWAPDGWTWGLIGVGDAPVQRYGVSSTIAAPRGNILILTDDRELAEAWFETARDLNTLGYTVWVMERASQGGSARYGGPRDLIHAPSFDDDIAATKALARNIVQGDPETPLTIVGQGVGALVALRAVQDGAPAAQLVFSSPRFRPEGALPSWPGWLMNLGVGRLPEALGQGWKREGPDDFRAGRTRDRQRGAVQMAWQAANPDLRMGGHSLGWTSAFATASRSMQSRLGSTKADAHMLLIPFGPRSRGYALDVCATMAGCTVTGTSPPLDQPDANIGASAFLGPDALRKWWIGEVVCVTPDHSRLPPMARDGCPTDRVSGTLVGHRL